MIGLTLFVGVVIANYMENKVSGALNARWFIIHCSDVITYLLLIQLVHVQSQIITLLCLFKIKIKQHLLQTII